MAEIIQWPICLLRPHSMSAIVVPFSRSGGRTLGGVEPSTRTDLGYWQISYENIFIRNSRQDQWRAWQAIRQKLAGRPGLIAVRVKSSLSAPYKSGAFEPVSSVLHDDGTSFDDGSPYSQSAISVVTDGITVIGSTQIRLRVINAANDMSGVRFSFQHALYETGPAIDVDGNVWTLPISPAVRSTIPPGADLDFDEPSCLCHLADDRGMEISQDSVSMHSFPAISFVEATDYWANISGS